MMINGLVKYVLWVVTGIFILGLTVFFYHLGQMLKSDDLLLVFSTIGTISGLIFTVAGLWAGYVFPEAIKIVFSGDKTDEKSRRIKEYESILIPVISALVCVILSLAVPPTHRILKALDFSWYYIPLLKGAGGILAFFLIFGLGWAVIKIITPSLHCLATMRAKVEADVDADERDPKR